MEALYESLLARLPQDGEEDITVEYLENGGSVPYVVEQILASPECRFWFHRNPIFDEITAPEPLPLDVARLYVWHIPKTGGTSLKEMLRPHFDEMEFCGGLTLSELYRMSAYRLRSFRVITGHFGPTLPQLLPEVPLLTSTLIRDPVDTVISLYGQWRDRGNPLNPITELARELPFDKWCRSAATVGLWSNPQATSLCYPRIPPTRQEALAEPEGAAIAVPGEQRLERAVTTLDRVDVVGTTSDLLAVYRACLGRLGLEPRLEQAIKENVGAGIEAPVSATTREWLLEHNAVDSTLFEQAKLRSVELQAPVPERVPEPIRVTTYVAGRPDPLDSNLGPEPDRGSLIPGWSHRRVGVLAACVSIGLAVWDASVREVLIGLLAIGPGCALLTGRWRSTALVGAWALLLAGVVGIPDGIWATSRYVLYLCGITAIALVATLAAAVIERRHDRAIVMTG